MKVLLVNAPSRRFSLVPPLGLLQVGAILEQCAKTPLIYDPLLHDPGMNDIGYQQIKKIISEFKPDIIGYGGIATSYGSVKKFSQIIKNEYPGLIQVAGGPLSSVYDLLLTKAGIDVVVHGEAELSLPMLLSRLEHEKSYEDIPGISFVDRNGNLRRNKPAEQIDNLDSIPFPAYHLVDLPRYFRHIKDSMNLTKENIGSQEHVNHILERIGDDDRWIEVITGRGCTHRCLFCYRHMKGIRYHSPDYVVRHIKFLREKYGIRGFQFADELFNATKERVYEICDAIRNSGIDIFFTIGGARVDRIDENLIRELKDVGCIEISYGQESGSDIILKEYRKGVTVEQNKEITKTTKSLGISCPVQIVIGSPKETSETVRETIQFLKDVDAFEYSLNYLIPLPETPIWSYVEEKKLIPDLEPYLEKVAMYGGQPLVNLTQVTDRIWKSWKTLIRKEMRLDYLKKNRRFFKYALDYILYSLAILVYPFLSVELATHLRNALKKLPPHHG